MVHVLLLCNLVAIANWTQNVQFLPPPPPPRPPSPPPSHLLHLNRYSTVIREIFAKLKFRGCAKLTKIFHAPKFHGWIGMRKLI